MKKLFKRVIKALLSKIIKIETLRVYDFEMKKEIEANYILLFGKYITTVYN